MKEQLLGSIERREACVGVVGLGYVGLPLLIEFAKAGFPVAGFDIDGRKTAALEAGESYIRHIDAAHVRTALSSHPASFATTDFSRIRECDAVLICVPTPLTEHRDPDLSFIESTARAIAPHLQRG